MDVKRLKVTELRAELGRRGLDSRGLKVELAQMTLLRIVTEWCYNGRTAQPREEQHSVSDVGMKQNVDGVKRNIDGVK